MRVSCLCPPERGVDGVVLLRGSEDGRPVLQLDLAEAVNERGDAVDVGLPIQKQRVGQSHPRPVDSDGEAEERWRILAVTRARLHRPATPRTSAAATPSIPVFFKCVSSGQNKEVEDDESERKRESSTSPLSTCVRGEVAGKSKMRWQICLF